MTGRIGRRRTRRILVALLYGGALGYGIANALLQLMVANRFIIAGSGAVFWIAIASQAAGFTGFVGLFLNRALRTFNATPDHLDERMLQRRNTVLSTAFWIMAFVCMLEYLAWSFHFALGFLRAYPAGLDLASPFLAGDMILALTLPIAVFAWTEPDPPRDDETG